MKGYHQCQWEKFKGGPEWSALRSPGKKQREKTREEKAGELKMKKNQD